MIDHIIELKEISGERLCEPIKERRVSDETYIK